MFKDPYVYRIVQFQARRYANKYCPIDELVSEGILAVVEIRSKYRICSYSLIDQAVKWRIHWYIRRDMKFRLGFMDGVEHMKASDYVYGMELLNIVNDERGTADYLYKGYSQVEIAEEYGVSKQRIHQLKEVIKGKVGLYVK